MGSPASKLLVLVLTATRTTNTPRMTSFSTAIRAKQGQQPSRCKKATVRPSTSQISQFTGRGTRRGSRLNGFLFHCCSEAELVSPPLLPSLFCSCFSVGYDHSCRARHVNVVAGDHGPDHQAAALNEHGKEQGGMGADSADYNGDGLADIIEADGNVGPGDPTLCRQEWRHVPPRQST